MQASTQTVWFAPLWQSPDYSSVDYFDLFSPSAPWSTAASHVQIFKIYSQLLEAVSDDQLQNLFADLDRRGIALALEFPPLVSENCGFVEGFGDAGAALRLATRIQQNGGLLRYIAMDEPLYYAGIYAGPNACRWTSQKIAANAVVQIAQIKKIFPGVETGDIEPFPTQDELDIAGWKERFAAWFDAWRQAAGTPLAFFHSDVARSPAWRHSIDVLRRYAAQRAIPFGIIYNGVGNETMDADWINNAEQRFVDYETHGGAPPDHVIFQSWNPYPKHLLPETDPTSFTHLINRYFRTRTHLTLNGDARRMTGQLTGSAGHPLESAAVEVSTVQLSGRGAVNQYVLTGTIPANAKSGLVGVRINFECGCQGASDITVSRFEYFESGHSVPDYTSDFSGGLTGWGLETDGQATLELDAGSAGLHFLVGPGQRALLNGSGFTVTPGAAYSLRVTARVSSDSVGSGYLALMFLSDKSDEVSRDTLPFELSVKALGTAGTAGDGSYQLDLAGLTQDAFEVDATYRGNDTFWPAAATRFLQVVPTAPPSSVLNAASYAVTGVSPGEIVTIFGSLLGDPMLSTLELNADGSLASELSNTRVLFDGVAAPLVYASSKQVSAIVPYKTAGQSTTSVTVEYHGFSSAPATLPVIGSAPGLFTLDASGRGPGAILNQDFSLNSAAKPAPKGSTVMIFATGEGQTEPAGIDGQITGTILRKPKLRVSATIGDVPAHVSYAGSAPGLVAGVLQVNVRVPDEASSGPAVPVRITVGTSTSQASVTIAIQ